MFFNKQKQIAFILPTKCGTHTVRNYLSQVPYWHSLKFIHEPLERIASVYPNLNQYTVYGFFRNPMLRFESAARHAYRVGSVRFESYDDFVDRIVEMEEAYKLLVYPQSHWFADPRVTPLDFDNLKSELHRITETTFPLEQLNAAGDSWRSEITDKVRSFVREYYAADYALAKDRLGKEY